MLIQAAAEGINFFRGQRALGFAAVKGLVHAFQSHLFDHVFGREPCRAGNTEKGTVPYAGSSERIGKICSPRDVSYDYGFPFNF